MNYPSELVGWLYDRCAGFDWRYTPLQLLDIERQLPGLVDDLFIEGWQRKLVKAQVDSEA